jgi:hypothetical protein
MNGVVYSGQVNGKSVVFTGTVVVNNVRYQGSIRSPNSMSGTFTQTLSGETCPWSATRIGAPPQQIAIAKAQGAKGCCAASKDGQRTAVAGLATLHQRGKSLLA